MPEEHDYAFWADAMQRLEVAMRVAKETGSVIDPVQEQLKLELTQVAHNIIKRRDDYVDLSKDARERLERRTMYRVMGEFWKFQDATTHLLEELLTEDPPAVSEK